MDLRRDVQDFLASRQARLTPEQARLMTEQTPAQRASSPGLSTPDEVVAFLQDFNVARGISLTWREQRAACGAAAWILAFNARWELALLDSEDDDGANLSLVRERGEDYLDLSW